MHRIENGKEEVKYDNVLEQQKNAKKRKCLNKGGIVQPRPEMRESCSTETNRGIRLQSHQDRKEIHQAPVVIRKIHACQPANEQKPVPYKNSKKSRCSSMAIR
jgi:hypothetical protein